MREEHIERLLRAAEKQAAFFAKLESLLDQLGGIVLAKILESFDEAARKAKESPNGGT